MSTLSTIQALEHDLAAAVPDGTVLTDARALEPYAADTYWTALHAAAQGTPLGRPDIVVVPRTEKEVAATVRLAGEHGLPVVPWGGGSGTQGGALATEGGVVIDLRGLDEILEIDPISMTVTAQAGVNGRALERELNERGLMLPHYPASAEWATVGGYVAARGSGVLSTRYGKVEDLLLSLRVVTPTGELTEMLPVPRHAAGPELTQLYVGSEGMLGVITQVTLQLVPLPDERRFEAVLFPSVADGIAAMRKTLQRGHRPSVIRLYDEVATRSTLSPVVDRELDGVCAVLCFEGTSGAVNAEASETLELSRAHRGESLGAELGETWWERRYEFYKPPHQPELPAIWGTIDVVATYARIEAVYEALDQAVRRRYASDGLVLKMHFSHWYAWGTMIYARFVVPDGGPDAAELHDRIWKDGVEAALAAGAVLNDHHGVGIKLAPFMAQQYGPALETLRRVKGALDPRGIMNPGNMGLGGHLADPRRG